MISKIGQNVVAKTFFLLISYFMIKDATFLKILVFVPATLPV